MLSTHLRVGLVLFGIFCTNSARAQTYGEWGRPCDLSLSPRFSAPFNHGVYYQGHEFQTRWQSVNRTMPLSSTEWYFAIPDPHPPSVDGDYQWDNAGVEVYCYIIRNPYFISYAATPTGLYRGTVRRATNTADGGGACGDSKEELYETGYTIYEDGSRVGDEDCGGGGGGGSGEGSGIQFEPGDYTGGETVDWGTGIGNGGTSICGNKAVVEWVCVDVYNESTGVWEEWSCGYATTC